MPTPKFFIGQEILFKKTDRDFFIKGTIIWIDKENTELFVLTDKEEEFQVQMEDYPLKLKTIEEEVV
jgi:hypothetical protein